MQLDVCPLVRPNCPRLHSTRALFVRRASKRHVESDVDTLNLTHNLNLPLPRFPTHTLYRAGQSKAGRLFFIELKTTLTKINEFYIGRETELQGRYDSLVKLDLHNAVNFKAFVMFYNDLMFLSSWATTNATAFDKITKKHDKKTGYVCSYTWSVQALLRPLRH